MKRMNTAPVLLIAAIAALLLTGGCFAEKAEPPLADPAATAELRASVTYRQQMLLPPRCTLFVSLENLSQLNPRDRAVASAFFPVQAAPPYPVVLRYDPAKLHQRLRYALTARIELNGQVLFAGIARIDPFSQPPDEPVEIVVAPLPKKTR